MDGQSFSSPLTPPEQPLSMPMQDFDAPFVDADAPRTARKMSLWAQPIWVRLAVFGPSIAATVALWSVIRDWFTTDGLSGSEVLLITLICFNFFWICYSLALVTIGFLSLSRGRVAPAKPACDRALDVALLVPIYNEDPAFVMGNLRAMADQLTTARPCHRYAMFVLSDTQDPTRYDAERRAFDIARMDFPADIPIYYRRRTANTERKTGNIADWVCRWGAGYEAMLVLDADSLMTAQALDGLADALRDDPNAGLVQSFPLLWGAQSLFGRMQQFASRVYGAALARGVGLVAGADGNYWGHNAMIRTRAFAACAGLPPLPGRKRASIMSHDFVEAGLMARAGWGVRFLPWLDGSFEETPQTLIDHVQRDRRWCQGNLQHLRLLGARGFRPMSRFHLLHGAVGYLLSPIWFALLVIWALIGPSQDASVLTYFNMEQPLRPSWPELTEARHTMIVAVMYAMLLAPKFVGMLALPLAGRSWRDFGGRRRFALSMGTEILLAVLYAPVLMVQQMVAVLRAVTGLQQGWNAQARSAGGFDWWVLLRFHGFETLIGFALVAGIAGGMVSWWLAPIAVSLTLAMPLSRISGWDLGARRLLRSDLHSRGAEADFDTQVPRHRAQVAAQMGR